MKRVYCGLLLAGLGFGLGVFAETHNGQWVAALALIATGAVLVATARELRS